MDELPPKAAALLAAARSQHEPTQADSQRVRAALAASLAGSVAADLVTPGTKAASAGASTAGVLTPTLGKLALLAGMLGGTAALWTGWPSAAPERPRSGNAVTARTLLVEAPGTIEPHTAHTAARVGDTKTDAEPRSQAREPSHAPEARPDVQAQTAAQARIDAVEPRANRPLRAAQRSAAANARAATQSEAVDAVVSDVPGTAPESPQPAQPVSEPAAAFGETRGSTDELALIRTALAQLNAGDPEQALALLTRHAARYPQGVMAEERRGLQAIALCAAGRIEAGVVAQRSFLHEAPNSALAARVRAACPRSQR